VEQVLVGHEYSQLGKAGRGLARRYIEKMTGLSRSQLTRLIALYTAGGRVQVTVYRRRRFAQLYTRAGIELLAAVDPVTVGQTGTVPARRTEHERAPKGRRGHQRHRCGAAHATGKS